MGDAVQVVARPDRVDPAVRLAGARVEELVAVALRLLVGFGVGWGVASGVGVTAGAVVGGGDDDGGALGEGDGLGDGDGEAIADGDATADGLGAAELASTTAGSVAGSTLGSSVGSMDGDGARAIAVEPGAAAMTGRSMPPRCTTKPNEIPADSTRIRIAATVAFGTAPDRLAAFGSSSAAVPLRYLGQSACAARRQTSSCWRADCGRGSPIAAQRLPSSGLRSGATRSPSSSNRKNGQTAGSGERAASSRIDSGGRGAGGGAATWADPASGGADPASGPASASPSAGVVGQSLRFNPPGELEPRTPRPRGV